MTFRSRQVSHTSRFCLLTLIPVTNNQDINDLTLSVKLSCNLKLSFSWCPRLNWNPILLMKKNKILKCLDQPGMDRKSVREKYGLSESTLRGFIKNKAQLIESHHCARSWSLWLKWGPSVKKWSLHPHSKFPQNHLKYGNSGKK